MRANKTYQNCCLILVAVFMALGPYQAYAKDLKVECGGVFDLCGYVDRDTGNEVIAKQFQRVRRFSEGKAAVRVDGLWGYIDETGKIQIPPQFEIASDFKENRAEVVVDGKAGIVDQFGTVVLDPKFGRAIPFTENVFFAVPYSAGKPRRSSGFSIDLITLPSGGLFHVSDGWLTGKNLEFREFGSSAKGLVWARDKGNKNLFGLMDAQGRWVVKPRFRHVQSLHENRAIVAGNNANQKDRWGAVDGDGKLVIPLEHDWLSYFENGYGLIGVNTDKKPKHRHRKLGLIAPDGSILGGRTFDHATRPRDGIPAQVVLKGIRYNLRPDGSLDRKDADGSLVAKCLQGLMLVRKGRGFEVRNSVGEATVSTILDRVHFNQRHYTSATQPNPNLPKQIDCDAPISIGVGDIQNMRWGFVKPDGAQLFPPDSFASVHSFAGGFTTVGTGKKWGVIDTDGRFTIPLGDEPISPQADSENWEGGPVFFIGSDGNYRYVDATGEPVEAPEKQTEDRFSQVLNCRAGVRLFSPDDGENWGVVGSDGKVILQALHRAVSCFQGGVAYVPNDEKQKWCPVGPNGEPRDAPACRKVFYPYFVTHHYPEKFSENPYESSVIWVRKMLRYGRGLEEKPPVFIGDGIMGHGPFSVIPTR